MMSRKKAIIILASVWCIAFVSLVFNWLHEGEKRGDIVTAFAARNYLSTNGVVSVYADYGNKYMSVEEKEEILKKLAIAVGIDEDIEFVSEREERDGGYMATTSYSTYNNYSTTEQVVGTWIDGKPIYRKVVSLGDLDANTKEAYIPTGINNVEHIVDFNIRFKFDDGNEFDNLFLLQYSYGYITPYIDYASKQIYVAHLCDFKINSVYSIIEYTKTTD